MENVFESLDSIVIKKKPLQVHVTCRGLLKVWNRNLKQNGSP